MSDDSVVTALPIPMSVTPEQALTLALRRADEMEKVIIIYFCDDCGALHSIQGGDPSRQDVMWMAESVKMRCLAPVIHEEVQDLIENE